MNFKINFFALFAILSASQLAQAVGSGMFIEPAITYETGKTTTDYPSPFSSSSGNADGFGLGAKLGFHTSEAFFLAVDGNYSMPKYKDSNVTYDANAVSTNWGIAAGIQMPTLGLRVLGTVILGGELNPEQSGNFDVYFKQAQGYRLGAGFRLYAMSLNLEYQQIKYDETILEKIGPYSSNSALNNVRLENKSWIASLSFPLEL